MLGGTVVRINKKWDEEENEYEEIQKSINNIIGVHVAKCDCNASFSKCGKAEQKECFPQCRHNLHIESKRNQGENHLDK